MSVSAIVPVWNGRALLERLLDSLDRQTVPPAEILVVDNGSSDGAPELARGRGARVLSMGRNAGFAAAVNRGIKEARGEYIAVLNSDVELAADYLAQLQTGLRTEIWFATGKILSALEPTRIDGTFDVVCRGAVAWRAGNGSPDGPAFSAARQISCAPWTAALFRTELFARAGLLEERFESYYEDVDFGIRCARLGLPGAYIPGAVAWHRGSAALGRWHPGTVRRISRNQVYLVARHYPPPLVRRWIWPILVAQILWGAVAVRHGAGWGWLRGKCEGLRYFRAARQRGTGNPGDRPDAVEQLCHSGEQVLRAAPGPFWRLYFLLTSGEAN